MTVITSIGTSNPKYRYTQDELYEYISEVGNLTSIQRRKLKSIYKKSAIESRYSILSDFNKTIIKNYSQENTRSIEHRLELFYQHAPNLAIEAIHKTIFGKLNPKSITHIITVSCTGMSAPGIEISLIESLKLNNNIQRSAVNFMGCYAAIHALQQANNICIANPDAIVLVVCVELCSIHFQNTDSDDNLLANSLFADGAAATIVVSDKYAKDNSLLGLRIDDFNSKIISEGSKDMAWHISSSGFLMALSAYIPSLIALHLKSFLNTFSQKIDISNIAHWAIHPGGRKILDTIVKELNISSDKIKDSYEVLKDYGNMSSPSILFVLRNIMNRNTNRKADDKIMALAFGPGLVMESCILSHV
ncbi:MAG: type III polyketide synthase [Cytophagales bacterium]|nr:MAG: type III polyketide synthase [Cytophagales bacterium]